jgi:hypothetical protein
MEYQANISPNYNYTGLAVQYCTATNISNLSINDNIGGQTSYNVSFHLTTNTDGHCEFSGGSNTFSWNTSCSPEQYANPNGLCINNILANVYINWNPPTGCTNQDDCYYNSPSNSTCVGDEHCIDGGQCVGVPVDGTSFCRDYSLITCSCACTLYSSCGGGACNDDQKQKWYSGVNCNQSCTAPNYHGSCGCGYSVSCNSGIDNVTVVEENELEEFITGTSAIFHGTATDVGDVYSSYQINYYRIYLTNDENGGSESDWVQISPTINLQETTTETIIYFTDDGTLSGNALEVGAYYIFFEVADDSGTYNQNTDGTDNLTIELIGAVNGCTDVTACNYDYTANTDNGTCTFPAEFTITCYYDLSGDGVLDSTHDYSFCPLGSGVNASSCEEQGDYVGDPVIGCMDDTAVNYNWSPSGEDVQYDDGKHCIFANILLSTTSHWERTINVNLQDPFVQDGFQTGWDDNTNYVATSLFATVDWGDESSIEIIYFYPIDEQESLYGTGIGAGNTYVFPTHTYETDGDYDIVVNVNIINPVYSLYQNTWSISLGEEPTGVNITNNNGTPYDDEVIIYDGVDSSILNLNGIYDDPGTPLNQINFKWTIINPNGGGDDTITTQDYGNYTFDIIGDYTVKFEVTDPITTIEDEITVKVYDPFFYQLNDFLTLPYTNTEINTQYTDLDHWLVSQGDIGYLLDGVLEQYCEEVIPEPTIYSQIIRLENDYFNIIGFTLNPENSPYDFESIINNSLFADEDANEPVDWPIGSIIVTNYFDINGVQTFASINYAESTPPNCFSLPFICCDADGNVLMPPGTPGVQCPVVNSWSGTFGFNSGQGFKIYIPSGEPYYLKWGVSE